MLAGIRSDGKWANVSESLGCVPSAWVSAGTGDARGALLRPRPIPGQRARA